MGTTMQAGGQPDLLSAIYGIQVRNQEKISTEDHRYCQSQQDLLYKTLDQIDRWYAGLQNRGRSVFGH